MPKIPPRKTNSKYNLSQMEVDQKKSFPVELESKIRLAAHFTGKRHGFTFVTRKMGKKITVFRVK